MQHLRQQHEQLQNDYLNLQLELQQAQSAQAGAQKVRLLPGPVLSL